MCRRTTAILRRLDWLGRLEFRDMTREPPELLPVPLETAIRGMPMRTSWGKVLVGYPAVRRALVQTPLGVLPALLLYVPGFSHIGRAVYGHIARNRARDACEVHDVPPSAPAAPGRTPI
ncbi:hypothetical protein PHYC_00878 [Phycisphaerales bacterium]|nr:hypothetical protein PHYC_00878 [Phycisphaerales bacterium]